MHELFRKGAGIALFLMICASCTPSCRQWHVEEANAVCPCYRLGKLYLPPQSDYNGLELELARCNEDVRMYINVFSVPFPWNPCEPSSVELIVIVDEVPFSYQADCLQGGQRLAVPQKASDQIIAALIDCKTVRLKAGRYSSTIPVQNFPVLFNEF